MVTVDDLTLAVEEDRTTPTKRGRKSPAKLETLPDIAEEATLSDQREAFTAFIKAQQEFGRVTKGSNNPQFKSKYADLGDVLSVAIPTLNNNNLFLVQEVNPDHTLLTLVVHVSGVIVTSSLYPIITKDASDPQKFGGGLTYARRYSVLAALGLAPEDDDGNLASRPAAQPQAPAPSAPRNPRLDELKATLKGRGFRPDTLPQAFEAQFGSDGPSTFSALTPSQTEAWLNALKMEPPF